MAEVLGVLAEQAMTVPCPACFSPANQRCTQASTRGRNVVMWVHLSREEAFRNSSDS